MVADAMWRRTTPWRGQVGGGRRGGVSSCGLEEGGDLGVFAGEGELEGGVAVLVLRERNMS